MTPRTTLAATATAVSVLAGLTALAGPADAAAPTHCAADVDTHRVACASDPVAAQQAAGASSSLVIARMYDGAGYTGATYTWYQSRACTASYDSEWQWDDLGQIGWSNRMSSVRTYNHCDVKLYDGTHFRGASSTWIDASSKLAYVGSGWGNRASSMKFS